MTVVAGGQKQLPASGGAAAGANTGTYIKRAEPLKNKVYIKQIAKQKMDRIVANTPGEVGWFGLVEIQKGFIIIQDIVLFSQEVSSASVDASAVDLHKLLEEHAEVADKLKFSGHSHGSLEAYFSSTDQDQIEDWGSYGIDWIISHVQNKKGQMETRYDQFKPFRMGCALELVTLVPQEIEDWVQSELEEKVKVVTAAPKAHGGTPGQTWQGHGKTHGTSGTLGGLTKEQPTGGSGVGRGAVPNHTLTRWLGGIKQEIVNGVIVREEEPGAGRVWVLSRNQHHLELVKSAKASDFEEDAKKLPKEVAPQDGAKLPPTPTQKDQKSAKGGKQKGKPTEPKIDPDEVVSEVEASRRMSNLDDEVIPGEVEETDEFVGKVEKVWDPTSDSAENYELLTIAVLKSMGIGAT